MFDQGCGKSAPSPLPPQSSPSDSHALVNFRIPNLEIGLPIPDGAQSLLSAIEKMSKDTKRLVVDCQKMPKEDLVHAFSAFPHLAQVNLLHVEFPLGDLPVPSTLKKLIISSPRIQLPALEQFSPKYFGDLRVTLKGTDM